MRTTLLFVMLSVIGLLAFAAKVTLVRDGKPNAVIVIAETPTENAKIAGEEFQKYIEKISGAKLAIETPDVIAFKKFPEGSVFVLIGRSKLTEEMKVTIPSGVTKNLQEEGFVILAKGNRLVLAGNDTEPYYGTRYAVYDLLNRLGVRWFVPGDFGEVVPRMKTIEFEEMSITEKPSFAVRSFWTHSKDGAMSDVRDLWKIRNKLNPRGANWLGMPGDSSVIAYMPKDKVKEHPEWFALNKNGSRNPNMPCMMDYLRRDDPRYAGQPRLVDVIVEKVKEDARQGRATAMAPEDGAPRCYCDLCKKMGGAGVGYGTGGGDEGQDASISTPWFHFVNMLMKMSEEEFPDHRFATNGYANRYMAPEKVPADFNARKNLVLMFADIGSCTIHRYDDPKCFQMVRQGEILKQWGKLCDKVWIYNYNYTMLVGKSTVVPMTKRVAANLPFLKRGGILGFNDQDDADMTQTGIVTYVVREALQWNADADVDAILTDFYEKWYGPAAGPMRRFYAALESAFDNAPYHAHEDPILPVIYTDELMASLDKEMVAAERAAASETEKLHVRVDRLMYDHLRDYVAAEKAKQECSYAETARRMEHMMALKAELNTISPYFGWHPYPVYQEKWEKERVEKINTKVIGPEGEMIMPMPLLAKFKTDPKREGEAGKWMAPMLDDKGWSMINTSTGWQNQGQKDEQGEPLCDEHGHPYVGVAWYRFDDVRLPEAARGKSVWLFGPAVVNQASVYVNGQLAGQNKYTQPWFRPQELEIDISRFIRPGDKNQITLRVLCNDENFGANGIYERLFLYARNDAPK